MSITVPLAGDRSDMDSLENALMGEAERRLADDGFHLFTPRRLKPTRVNYVLVRLPCWTE